jgi:hypothetical protein
MHHITFQAYILKYPSSKTTNRKSLADHKKQIIKRYLKGESSEILSSEYKCATSSICRLLKKAKVTRPMSLSKRRYLINEEYFDKIDTEGKAYFLGLLYADGYNSESKRAIVLTLHKKDIGILVKLNKDIGSNKPLRTETGLYYKLIIENKHLSEALSFLGCMQAKTFKILFPANKIVPDYLSHHFMRGYFDGDGYISKDTNSSQAMSITSNELFAFEYRKHLEDNCNLSPTKLYRYKNSKIVTVTYGGRNQLCRIYNFLYKDATFFLQRKKNRFLNIAKGRHLINRYLFTEKIDV